MGLKAAGYIRVSKDKSEGGKKGEIVSPAQQEEAVRRLCAERGWEIWGFESDIDYSGFRIPYEKRPGLMKLLDAAAQGEFEALCVYRMDRSARRAFEQADIVRLFARHGVEVYSATERFDPLTPIGRFQRNLMAPVSEYFSEIHSQNIKDARLAMLRAGRPPGGLPPFGYRWENKTLVPDAVTAPLVKRMFERALQAGTDEPVRKVWDIVREAGVQAPLSRRNWHRDTIRYILRNPIYVGKIRYAGELYALNIQPLVDEKLWNAVQAIMVKGKAHNSAKKHLMVGFLWCGNPAHPGEGWSPAVKFLYEYYTNHEGIHRYMCRTAHRYLTRTRCDYPLVAADGFERVFVRRLIGWLRAYGARDRAVPRLGAAEVEEIRKAINDVTARIGQIGDMIDGLFEEYQRYGTITREQFADRNRRYLEEQAKLRRERMELDYRLALLDRDEPRFPLPGAILLEGAWEDLTFEERRQVVGLCVKRAVVLRDRVVVETFDDPFELTPTLVWRNVLYFDGEEPKENPGMFGRRHKQQAPPR